MRTDPSEAVHAAIADAIRVDASNDLWSACTARLLSPNEETRGIVIDALLRRHAAGHTLAAELRAHATNEENAERRATLLRTWMVADGNAAVLYAISARPTSEVVLALRFFEDERVGIESRNLEALFDRDDPAIDVRLVALHLLSLTRLPVGRLLEIAAKSKDRPFRSWTPEDACRWEAMRDAILALRPMLASMTLASPAERATIERLGQSIERETVEMAAYAKVDVDAIVRFARGECTDSMLNWMEDDECDVPLGTELLPDLKRLAAAVG
jgi:hypothetical protein